MVRIQGCILPAKHSIQVLTESESCLFKKRLFFSFLVIPWSTIFAKSKEFIVKYILERPWSLEEGSESHPRATVILGTEMRS